MRTYRPLVLATLATMIATLGWSQEVIVAVPARAGAVEGTKDNSDAYIWRVFTEFVAPAAQSNPPKVVFETWASDKDTFAFHPHWPEPNEPMDLHTSVLEVVKMLDTTVTPMHLLMERIDEPCKPPKGAAVANFPTTGTPAPCIVEQVSRNRPQYDYIVGSNLNTQAGLAVAYAKSLQIDMPKESIAIKGDWIPLPALLQWIPSIGDTKNIRKLYYTVTVSGTEYALVAMHVSTRQNPNWVWATFEHQMNPGRCDYIGCFDSFGSQTAEVRPNFKAFNSQYGPCLKTNELKALMRMERLSPVWDNYCLKSTQVDYVRADGVPYVLGNSVIEGIAGNGTVAASSCISCHAYASFGKDGIPTPAARAILPFNPTGNPIPSVLTGSHQFHFMWGVLQAP